MKYENNVEIKINLSRLRLFFIVFVMCINLSEFISARKSLKFEVNTKSKVKWKQVVVVKQAFDAERRPLCPPLLDVFDNPEACNDVDGSEREKSAKKETFVQPPIVDAPAVDSSKVDAPIMDTPVVGTPEFDDHIGGPPVKAGADTVYVDKDQIIITPEKDCPEGHNRDWLGRCKVSW